MPVVTRCLQCGKVRARSASQVRAGRGRFCSRSCAGKHYRGARARRYVHGGNCLQNRECLRCGQTFVGKVQRNYCSRHCALPPTFKACAQCGSRFKAGHLAQRFCSRPCHYAYRSAQPRTDKSPPTPEARRAQAIVRRQVLAGVLIRADRCEQCSKPGYTEAAHADYAQPTNVRWLCLRCHRLWDQSCPKGGTVKSRLRLNGRASENAPAHAEAVSEGSP